MNVWVCLRLSTVDKADTKYWKFGLIFPNHQHHNFSGRASGRSPVFHVLYHGSIVQK